MSNIKINDVKRSGLIAVFLVSIFLFSGNFALANNLPDADKDGVPDKDETGIYHTDPNNPDTDGDGFRDRDEIIRGYSPLDAKPIKLKDNDHDKDGLTDLLEIKFHTDPTNPDTDNDGNKDGDEIKKSFDPLKGDGAVLSKSIEVNLDRQELSYVLGDVKINTFKISSGKKGMWTPTGTFTISNKSVKAWSKNYGLWMPYWLGITGERFGIHELPIWPNGYREGSNHLGIPVSHGCIRLGIGPAKELYDWTPVGTSVYIH